MSDSVAAASKADPLLTPPKDTPAERPENIEEDVPSFDVEAAITQARKRRAAIEGEIKTQQQRVSDAYNRIKFLRAEDAKLSRFVAAGTPRGKAKQSPPPKRSETT